jgi:hypothetical protein
MVKRERHGGEKYKVFVISSVKESEGEQNKKIRFDVLKQSGSARWELCQEEGVFPDGCVVLFVVVLLFFGCSSRFCDFVVCFLSLFPLAAAVLFGFVCATASSFSFLLASLFLFVFPLVAREFVCVRSQVSIRSKSSLAKRLI